jgi:hypothetical protein
MKKTAKILLTLLLISFVSTTFACIPYGKAATPADIEASIVKGLAWLATQQAGDGSWGTGTYYARVAYTGMAVLKFETRAVELNKDPLDPSYEYYAQVRNGLDFIFNMSLVVDISVQTHGNPDSNGDGKGVVFNTEYLEGETYATGIASMAIAASTHPDMTVSVAGSPVDGWKYKDVEQDVMDYLTYGQNEESNPGDWWQGGWGYEANQAGWSDQSNTGYAVLGLIYGQAPLPHGFGLTIPQFVKDELNIWIGYIQNPVDGDANDGGSGYESPDDWVNILKTGTLLQEMALVGDTLATPRVDEAIKYIERHWNDTSGDPGWKWNAPTQVHKQAMYTTMKGFEAFNIKLIDADGGGIRDDDWYNEFADDLLAEQAVFPEGHWNTDWWTGEYVMPTCWALLILEKAAPPVAKYDLTVHVVDDTTNNPISGAGVTANGPEIRSGTTDGGFVKFLDVLAGDYLVSASAAGYDSASMMVSVSADTEVTIRLKLSGPHPVGGFEVPINTLTLLAPWILLGLAVSFGTIAATKLRRKS